MTSGWLYVLACVIVPAVWGVAMYHAFEIWERRRRRAIQRDVPPPIDYSI